MVLRTEASWEAGRMGDSGDSGVLAGDLDSRPREREEGWEWGDALAIESIEMFLEFCVFGDLFLKTVMFPS